MSRRTYAKCSFMIVPELNPLCLRTSIISNIYTPCYPVYLTRRETSALSLPYTVLLNQKHVEPRCVQLPS
jgi:hypothetical protein